MSPKEHYFVVKAVMTPAGPQWSIDTGTGDAMFDGQMIWNPDEEGQLGMGSWTAVDDDLETIKNDDKLISDLAQRLNVSSEM